MPISNLAATTFDVGLGPTRMIDVVVVGAPIAAPTQPDVDVDGDGLESLSDDDGDGQVDKCVEGSGTSTDGVDCALALQDGYSCAWDFEGVWVALLGVPTPSRLAG